MNSIENIGQKAVILLSMIMMLSYNTFANSSDNRLQKRAGKVAKQFASRVSKDYVYRFKVDSLSVDSKHKELTLFMNPVFSYIPFRPETVKRYKGLLISQLGRRFKNYTVRIKSMGLDIEELIPNFYRNGYTDIDKRRFTASLSGRIPLVRNKSVSKVYQKGLNKNSIALWHSHGWYYENTLDRWEWQRARVFTTVEDLWPMQYVLNYITPMLEKAGATVLLPRERDVQSQEVIVDKERSSAGSQYIESGEGWSDYSEPGFADKYPFLLEGENPFQMGGSRMIEANVNGGSKVEYIPNIPSRGEYSVYVSYSVNDGNVTDAHYRVRHLGGETDFLVNQSIGGKTWVYLGTFLFEEGKDPSKGMVELINKGDEKGKWVSADAVRFGGGMGNIARGPIDELEQLRVLRDSLYFDMDSSLWAGYVSSRPRYQEGARYYMQYAGMPDSLVYSLNKKSPDNSKGINSGNKGKKSIPVKQDYKDDYMCRGEWVDYLMGAPNGPTKNPEVKGLGVPIDMAFAFHTDAGFKPNDGIIGTLAIYNTTRDTSVFPTGQSKWASRDLVDIIQSQIVDDIKKMYEPKWTRRGMWNKQYSEAYRPKVPTMLLELLSHHNFADMYQGMDPQFQFDVSRSIYKGMLKYLSFQDGREFVVQPLPIVNFKLDQKSDCLLLSWSPVEDPLEKTADAKSYKVYTRVEDNDFDNGVEVKDTHYCIPKLKPGVIYSFKVTALNDGGESFDSEILAYCKGINDKKPVLIVNGFDRVSAPAAFDDGKKAGFLSCEDEGVAYKRNIAFVGDQYDFDRKSPWLDDDASGHGSCYADYEERIIPGNIFDYPIIHGKAIRDNGYGFVSMSDEAFEKGHWRADDFWALDIIMGEEKTSSRMYGLNRRDFTIYTPAMRKAISQFLKKNNSRFLMTGAYVGTDIKLCGDTLADDFARDVLHFKLRTNHATKIGNVYHPNEVRHNFSGQYGFVTDYNPNIYKVESPDAIEPCGSDAKVFFRYRANNKSAAVVYDGDYKSIILGFPFETIQNSTERAALMRQILKFFEK